MNFQYLILLLMTMLSHVACSPRKEQVKIDWTLLEAIPDAIGFAGAYAATVGENLVLMGGANFPDGKAPWDGGKKVWTDRIFMLKDKNEQWIEAGHLPEPMGYGAVASYNNVVYIAGGSNEQGHLSTAYRMLWKDEQFVIEPLPNLPHTLANCASVRIGNYWYILGGIEKPDSKEALNICWRLDMDYPENGWEAYPAIPGDGRMLSVAGDMDGTLIVVSGTSLQNGRRQYLRDTYILDTTNTWQKIADLPESVTAAPNPAWFDGKSGNLLIFGGDNGELASKDLRENHPGFSNRVLCYKLKERTWHYADDIISVPQEGRRTGVPVTTSTVFWQGGIVLPSGEVRPGVRTAQVLFGTIN